jgi:hypothetical protein
MKTRFSKKDLMIFLRLLDDSINYDATVISAGGTALGLIDMKPYSHDIDFAYITKRETDFREKAMQTASKLAIAKEDVHIFSGAEMIALTNIPDFIARAVDFKEFEFKHIDLKIMNLYDILLSKVERFVGRDIEDIDTILTNFKINEEQLDKRYDFVMRVYQDYKPDFIRNYQLFKKLYKHLLK